MSSWSDSAERANQAFLATWGVCATLLPQDGSAPVQFTGVFDKSGLEDEVLTGGHEGTAAPRFWVDYSAMCRKPQRGDQVVINGVTYDLPQKPVDIEGGAVLKLRKNA